MRFASIVALVSFFFPTILHATVVPVCLKELLKEGQAVYGPFVSVPDGQVVENLAISGRVPFVFLDGEHSPGIDPATTLRLVTAADAKQIGTVVRVPSNDFDTIKRYIGTGVQGVVIPGIRTAEDARRAVDATKYPPLGRRAAGVERGNDWFATVTRGLATANDRMLTVVMIETTDAVKHIGSIVAVPGIDVVHVGPADLALDLGVPFDSPKVREAIGKVELAAKTAGIALGGHAKDRLTAQSMRRRGYRFFTIPGDMTLLQEGPRAFFDGGAAALPEPAKVATWQDVARVSARKYHELAWEPHRKLFLSAIDGDGKLTSEKTHLVALSRALYGLVHADDFWEAKGYWQRPIAMELADTLLAKFVRTDDVGPYFVTGVDANFLPIEDQKVLKIHEQAYGLCGLVAYVLQFRHSARHGVPVPDNFAAVEQLVARAARAFFHRFADDVSMAGGFVDTYDLTAKTSGDTKSFESIVYPATAFLMDLAAAMREGDPKLATEADARLEKLAGFVYLRMAPHDQPFIVEEFDLDGNPAWKRWKREPTGETMTLVGHNFQAAWFLLRMAERTTSETARLVWRDTAARILRNILVAGYDREFGGVFDVLVRETGALAYHDRKAWWQNAEALLALELAHATELPLPAVAEEARRSIEIFFLGHFVDPNGLEWDVVQRDGSRFAEATKGNPGKSLYHTRELVRFLTAYRARRMVFPGGQP